MNQKRIDANIIISTPHLQQGDDLLLFGKWGATRVDERIYWFPPEVTWADILVKFGIFSSKGQARKAGWNTPIPDGWTEISIGKLAHSLWVWKPGAVDESQWS